MNSLTGILVGLTAVCASAVYSVPADAHWVDATQGSFQYDLGEKRISKARSRHLDANALGNDRNTARSLGFGGSAVFSFGTAFTDRVRIWDPTSGDCNSRGRWCSSQTRKVSVFAGNSGDFDASGFPLDTSQWTLLGALGPSDVRNGYTFKTTGVFQYLLIVDHGASRGRFNNGFDIARVSVLAAPSGIAAVPIPAAVWLFGSGLLGLAAVARRRHAAHRAC